MRLQPSELAKIGLVMMLAYYYDRLPLSKVSHPLWVLVPIVIILVPTASFCASLIQALAHCFCHRWNRDVFGWGTLYLPQSWLGFLV